MASAAAVDVDGSVLEGGGQVVRNVVALSAVLGVAVAVRGVRAGRAKPGLQAQHLAGVQLVQQLCDAAVTGVRIQATEFTFTPRAIVGGSATADTHTAGSVALLIQSALPCAIYAPVPCWIVLRGGTNASMAPLIDYMERVFLPIAARHTGFSASIRVVKRGFFPKGGGEVVLTTEPLTAPLRPIRLEDKGTVKSVRTLVYVAGTIPAGVGARIASAARKLLRNHFGGDLLEEAEMQMPTRAEAHGNGCGILIVMETSTGCLFGASALGEQGKSSEAVGEEAANALIEADRAGGCVDEHLQDQLIVFMALAAGASRILTGPLSLHTETAIHVAQLLTKATFTVTRVAPDDPKDQRFWIACDGIGRAAPA